MGRRRAQGPSVSFFAFQDIITSVVGIFVLITLIMMVELVSSRSRPSATSDSTEVLEKTLSSMQDEIAKMEQISQTLTRKSKATSSVQRFNVDEIREELTQRIKLSEERKARMDSSSNELTFTVKELTKQARQVDQDLVAAEAKREELKKLLDKLKFLDSQIGELTTEKPMVFRNATLAGKSLIIVDVSEKEIQTLHIANKKRDSFTGISRFSNFQSWVSNQRVGGLHFVLFIRPGGAGSFDKIRSDLLSQNASFGFDVLADDQKLKLRSEVEK